MSVSGVSRELFKAANSMIGHLRGGLGVATVVACGGFAAICGSSVATAATFSAVAYPEMRRFNYPQSFSTGVIAAGGTLGAILPPSTVLAVYAILTQQDIGKLFMAGIVPGILAMAMYVMTIAIIVRVRPDWLPAGELKPWSERVADLKNVWAPLVLFVFVIGGLYGGFFTPTEAGGVGASGAFILGLLRGKLDRPKIRDGASVGHAHGGGGVHCAHRRPRIFGYFPTITQPAEAHRIPHRPRASGATACWR